MTVTVHAYHGASPTVHKGDISEVLALEWMRGWREPRGATIEVRLGNPAVTGGLVDPGTILRVRIDGTDHAAYRVAGRHRTRGRTEQTWTRLRVECADLIDVFADGLVEPEGGLDRHRPDFRMFGWMASVFDPTGWTDPVSGGTQSAPTATTEWAGYPQSWPDPSAHWIWGAANPRPPETCYFIRKLVGVAAGTYHLYASADNEIEVWINGQNMLERRGIFQWRTTWERYVDLPAGDSHIAVRGINHGGGAGTTPAGMLFSLWSTNPDGTDNTVVARSTDAVGIWQTLIPATPPGMTPGAVMDTVLAECQSRGELPGVTKSFTASLDSAGQLWKQRINWGMPVGQSAAHVLEQLVEQGADFRIRPDLTLDLYTNPRGVDRSASVTFTEGVNVGDGSGWDEQGRVVNAALVRTQEGWWRPPVDQTSVDTYGRRAVYEQFGGAPELRSASPVVSHTYGLHARPSRRATIAVVPNGTAVVPGTHFSEADHVAAPDVLGVQVRSRVHAIGGRVNRAGGIDWVAEMLADP